MMQILMLVLGLASAWADPKLQAPFEKFLRTSPATMAEQFRLYEQMHGAAGYTRKGAAFSARAGDEDVFFYTYEVTYQVSWETRVVALFGNFTFKRGVISALNIQSVEYRCEGDACPKKESTDQ